MDKAELKSIRKDANEYLRDHPDDHRVKRQLRLLDHIDALEQKPGMDDGFRKTFLLQRKGVGADWEDQAPGFSRKEDALACVKFCKHTADRPLRILEIRTRVVADSAAIDAAIAAAPEPQS